MVDEKSFIYEVYIQNKGRSVLKRKIVNTMLEN